MRISSHRRLGEDSQESFEGIRQIVARVTRESGSRHELLASATLCCQKGGAPRTAFDCLTCAHLLDLTYDPGAGRLAVRCQHDDDDRVSEIMTLPSQAVQVDPEAPVRAADELARVCGVRHLLVTRDDELLGVVCRCDLVPTASPGELVVDRMAARPWAVDAGATLGQAAALMRTHGIGLVPVVDGDRVVGLVTRGDLRRLGMPDAALGGGACAACGSTHGVCCDPRRPGAEFCLDCHDKGWAGDDEDEGWGG